MKIDRRAAAIAAALVAVGGIAVAKSRGTDHLVPSPSSASEGPGAASVESDDSAENKPRTYPSASHSPSPSASPSPDDSEREGNETSDSIGSDVSSDDGSDSSDSSDSDSADQSDVGSDSGE
jgi:hypothetical protein